MAEETLDNLDGQIAIVGMAGRFPGARDVRAFWRNLRDGVESVEFLPGKPGDPSWVSAVAMPEGIDEFDAPFFGISHSEAEVLDPQQRLFLETCWAAMEDAGRAPGTPSGVVAVYGGATTSTYLLFNLARNPRVLAEVDPLRLIIGNAVDSLASRVSYKLDLKGASHAVQCACSTSLVAVHLACQALLDQECDMALAGGVSINVGQRRGYRYQEDSILSPDGHCRAFDAGARGTLFGGGVGVVALKRLTDALADGDPVRAVILGSAVNNDGAAKAGYTAPSVDGQAAVITEALSVAGVDADSISYLEAHGTGTALGDPIEVLALGKALRSRQGRRGWCALGTVKTNIGHLDIAAGAAGLIKTVLALEHRQIPPTLHYERPNPRIDFAASPVHVNRELADWPAGGEPRRAGVSAFGIGGTNAHLVLEEAPVLPARRASAAKWHLLAVSAKTEPALAAAARNLAAHLREHPETDLGDASFTLLAGRQAFDCRLAVVCRDAADAASRLESLSPPEDREASELVAAGRRWVAGEALDVATLFAGRQPRRISLPTYPFERHKYWIEGGIEGDETTTAAPVAPAQTLHPRPALPTPFVAPRGEAEERVAAVWREVLGLAEVGAHDSFLELGGDSLLATRLLARLRELGADLTMDRLFAAPTIAAIAASQTAARAGDERIPRRAHPSGEDVPLSFAQERLWFLHQLDPHSSAYHIAAALHLRGVLDLGACARALSEMVRRHEALRTSFVLAAGEPRQRVLAAPRPVYVVADLVALPADRRMAERDRLERAAAARPFDLADGPLLRVLLLRLGAAEQRAVFILHHIVGDGWSVDVMVREFAALYRAYASGLPSPLPTLPIQYGDYAEWQRQWLRGERLEGELDWWRQTLAGAPSLVELPADRPRPPVQRFHGRNLLRSVDAAATARFQAFCRGEGATLFMGLLAAFEALLSRHGAGTDVVVGTPVAGRGRVEVAGLVGLFLNNLPLRGDLSGDPDAREMLARARRSALEAFAHQDLPFGRLVEALVSERNLGHAPVYQVMLVLQNARRLSLELPGLEVEEIRLQEEGAKLDLSLSVEERDGGLLLRWIYNRDLFDDATVARLSERFETLLAAMAEQPTRPLSALDLLPAGEAQQLREWNDTAANYPESCCLHELLAAQAARTPGRVAVTCEDRSLTYGELDAAANRLAHRLQDLDVGPEILVGLCAERSLEMVVALLAVLKAGGAYLPLDPEYPPERLAFMLADAGVLVLLAQEHLLAALPPHDAAVVTLEGLAEGGEDVEPVESGAVPGDLAYVIYTSGSTGRPKGTMNAHRGIVNRLLWMQERYGLGADDRVLQKTPFSFDVSVWEFFWPLLAGARLVMAAPGGHRDSAYLVRTIVEEGITTLHFVPSMLQVFLEAPGVERCTGLRRVLCSGEALPWELERRAFARLPGVELHNLYGPTEAAVDVTFWACEPGGERGAVPIGRPVANTRIHIVDGGLRPAPIGVPGELLIGGVQVGRGYLARPDLTAERFVPDPFGAQGERLYRTGDLARLLPDGAVDFLGRLDHQVKVRGLRIELGEIEAALAAHPAVRDAVVVARAEGDALGAVNLVAYVTPRQGAAAPALTDLRETLGASLPEYMLPAALVVLEAMPLTASGKVDRKALPAPERTADADGEAWKAPRNPLEQELARLWSEVLGGVEEATLGIHDNFFQVGGNSITGAIFINRLQERLEEIVHVVTLFDAPTLAQLAAHLAAEYPRAVERLWGAATLEAYGARTDRQGRRVNEELLAEVRRLLPGRAPEPEGLKNPRAVFILSPPRSGSTLLRVMLAGHPELFAPPELELLHFATLDERRDAFSGRDAFRLEGLLRAVMEARACTAEEAREIVAGLEAAGCSTRELYRRLQEWIGGRLLVDKTPTYAWSPGAMREAEAAFDRPFYVHLLRHPYGVIRSFEEARIDQVFFDAGLPWSRRELAEAVWVLAYRNTLDFLAGVPGERQITLRYEDLVRDPESELRRLCGALGVAYHDDMAAPYRHRDGRMTDGLHRESRMLGDVKFLQHAGVDATAADRWHDWLEEDFLGEPARALASRLGYEVKASRPGWISIPRRAADGEPPPLSFAQERMWFLHQLDPGSSAYDICGSFQLRGTLDAATFERCFAEVVRRHEALRTTFSVVNGQPVQIVHPPSGHPLARVDLAALPAAARGAEALRLAAADAALPFDLQRGPLYRFTLLRLEAGEHVLLLNIHHACSDGWSIRVLARELAVLYRAFAASEPSPLPELPIQYADFALWQRRTLQGETLENELGWWRRHLAGELPPLRLPADRRRSTVRGFQAEAERLDLPPDLVRGLEALSRGSAASIYMTLLAAWQGLLARLTGEEDVLVGAPTAGRNRPELEGLIGFFLNTLVLRSDLSGDPTFRQALARVRESTLGAFAHQDIPLQTVLQAAQPEREWAQTAPFQAMFLLQNFPPEELAVPGLTFEPLDAGHDVQDLGTAIFEVGLTLVEEPEGGLQAHVTYNGQLFDPASMALLLERYRRLLEAVVADPERGLWSYELMGGEERAQVLAWGAGPSAPATGLVHCEFEARAAAAPEAPAVIAGRDVVSYGELDRRANQLAWRLRELGVGPEVTVAVALDRSPELIVAFLGVLKAGGAYVPLDPSYPRERLAWILEDAGPRVLVSRTAVLAAHRGLAAGGIGIVDLDAEAPALAVRPATRPDIEADPGSLVYVVYTSGSTGRPKGVMVRHGALAGYVASFRAEQGLRPADRVLQLASIGFDTSAEEIYPCLTSGAALVLRDEAMLGSDFLRACGELGISVLDLPTAFWHEMVARLTGEPAPLPAALRSIVLGGERVLPERLVAWHALGHPGVRLFNTYGPTEATIVATRCELPPDLAVAGEVPIGRPVPGAWTRVADPRLELAPAGVPGELCLGGAGLARGYLGRPDLTAERFVPDPWAETPGERLYRTGDLVRLLPSGDLEFLGRVDHQVKIRGFRVELREIEAALGRHPGVAEAVVTAREDVPGDLRLAAYLVPRDPGADLAVAELRAFLRERLPDYMIPAAFVVLPALPLSSHGKVDRRALPAPGRARSAEASRVAPRTPAEEMIAAIWGELLGIDGVGATDNFFELGGHSLLLPQVMHRLRKAFQIEIPLRALFDEPTVEGLALAVEELVLEDVERQLATVEGEESVAG